jgi:hypothetical protein
MMEDPRLTANCKNKLQLKKDESFAPQLCMLSQSWNIYIILTNKYLLKKFANNPDIITD